VILSRGPAWLILGFACFCGCEARPFNPSLPLSPAEAEAEIRRMRAEPIPLQRPVVFLTGWFDPGFGTSFWQGSLREIGVPPEQRLALTFMWRLTFDDCREHVIEAVQEKWPSDDPDWTTEVDVIGFSMGGLIARYAAAAPQDPQEGPRRRLRMARLFTISSPHRGAQLADLAIPGLTPDPRVLDMRRDSSFLVHLDEQAEAAGYELVAYTRTGDWVIDERNTAPPGVNPWWVATPFLHRPHQEAYRDPRIEADILRRLRGQTPLTVPPATPVPGD
jgi:pimeloyl-ACP methyl ester carboxylesterase